MSEWFRRIADRAAHLVGTPGGFAVALGIVLAWLVSGPFLRFSDTWQLIISSITTVATFLLVVLIQATQNRNDLALQIKLDELIRVSQSRNTLIGAEHLADPELEEKARELEDWAKEQDDPASPSQSFYTEGQQQQP